MQGFVNWFINTIQSFIVWEIRVITSDTTSMVMWISVFNVLILTFVAMGIWGGSKLKPIVILATVAMFVVSIVTVALIT